MEKLFNAVSASAGIAGGLLAAVFGGWDALEGALLTLMVIDYISGVVKAVYKKELSSSTGFEGILKKVMIMLVLAAACSVERAIGAEGLREIVITFFAANEAISILENAAEILPNMPDKLKDILLQIRNGGGNK